MLDAAPCCTLVGAWDGAGLTQVLPTYLQYLPPTKDMQFQRPTNFDTPLATPPSISIGGVGGGGGTVKGRGCEGPAPGLVGGSGGWLESKKNRHTKALAMPQTTHTHTQRPVAFSVMRRWSASHDGGRQAWARAPVCGYGRKIKKQLKRLPSPIRFCIRRKAILLKKLLLAEKRSFVALHQ